MTKRNDRSGAFPEALLVGGLVNPGLVRLKIGVARALQPGVEINLRCKLLEVQLPKLAFDAQAQLIVFRWRPGRGKTWLGIGERPLLLRVTRLLDRRFRNYRRLYIREPRADGL